MDGKLIAVVVVSGVAAILALINYLTEAPRPMTNRPDPPRPYRPPVSPPQRRRRRSSRSPSLTRSSSSGNTSSTCQKCKKKPSVEVYPCKHAFNCKDCFDQLLKSSEKCPVCFVKIDSCCPQLNTWGKCNKCNQFSKLILVIIQ
ncbi:hypothetical protein TNCV_4545401 [Trichonephila clavipes]|nr:hypothetical protein TNCV_4545401 [Trichonephila clavipes]